MDSCARRFPGFRLAGKFSIELSSGRGLEGGCQNLIPADAEPQRCGLSEHLYEGQRTLSTYLSDPRILSMPNVRHSSMPFKTTFPPEIELQIIDQLGFEGDDPPLVPRHDQARNSHHIDALYNCALTCKGWLFRGRVNLYRNINIIGGRALAALRWTLETRPHFRCWVHTLCLRDVTYRRQQKEDPYPLHHIFTLIWTMLPKLESLDLSFSLMVSEYDDHDDVVVLSAVRASSLTGAARNGPFSTRFIKMCW